MELDVTHMVAEADSMIMLSGSRLEHGPDAGKITFDNSVAFAKELPLLKDDRARDEARTHFAEYGAWSMEEIDAWSEDELQGVMAQEVANAIREMEAAKDYDDYVRLCEAGSLSSNLYRGDDGRWYYYLGT